MSEISCPSLDHLARQGYAMLQGICSAPEMDSLVERLSVALEMGTESSTLRSRGSTYGSRNLLATFPEVIALVSRPALREFTTVVLGPDAGIVRALFFDKPPERSWSLPWHKDRTIAVNRNDLSRNFFRSRRSRRACRTSRRLYPAWRRC